MLGDDTAHMARLRWFVACCVAAAFLPLMLPLATGTVFTQLDVGWFHLPLRHVYREAILTGGSILWSPALFSGFYILGEGQIGALHPYHALLYRYLSLDHAFNLEVIGSYAFAWVGMYLVLRRFRCTVEGAILGGMLFALSGFNLLHYSHVNMVAIASHMPWVILAADLMLDPRSPSEQSVGFVALALLVGSQLLLGFPQFVWMTALLLGPFSIWRILKSPAILPGVAWLTFAYFVGVCLGGAQLLPTLDAYRDSVRQNQSLEFAFSYSLHPLDVVQLWSPYLYRLRGYDPMLSMAHEYVIYNSAFCTLAIAWLLIRRRQLGNHASLALGLLVYAAFALLMSLGKHGGLYWIVAHTPILDRFRAPSRHIVLFHFALAALATVAFDDLVAFVRRRLRMPWSDLWPLGALLAISLATLAVAAFVWARFDPPPADFPLSSLPIAAFGTVLVVATAAVLGFAARGYRAAPYALVFLVCADLAVWGYSYVWSPRESLSALQARVRLPDAATPGEYFHSAFPYAHAPALLGGFRMSNGYAGLTPSRVLSNDDETSLRLAGVRYSYTPNGWQQVKSPMPRARLVVDARIRLDITEDLKSIDIAHTVLIDRPVGALSGIPGIAQIERDDPGRLVVGVSAEGRQLLVLSERYHDGWQATADGRPVQLIRVYGDYLGCVVEPQMRRVDLTFNPRSARLGPQVSAIGIVLLVGGALLIQLRARRRS